MTPLHCDCFALVVMANMGARIGPLYRAELNYVSQFPWYINCYYRGEMGYTGLPTVSLLAMPMFYVEYVGGRDGGQFADCGLRLSPNLLLLPLGSGYVRTTVTPNWHKEVNSNQLRLL